MTATLATAPALAETPPVRTTGRGLSLGAIALDPHTVIL